MRSLLFVPGDDERKIAKGLACAADALILDLEDAVAPARKAVARELCQSTLLAANLPKRLLVRINSLGSGEAEADLEAVVAARPYGIVLPKCGSGADVTALARLLDILEAGAGIAPASIRILPIVTETAASLFSLGSYANPASPRLCGMMWGGEDLAADLGALANRDACGTYTAPYQLARTLCLAGAIAAGVDAVDSVYTDFRNQDGLHAEAVLGVRDGFSAKAAIHPDQIGAIHAAFTPPATDVEYAVRVVSAFSAAGSAGVVSMDGRMLDRPHYRGALRVLGRAQVAGMALPNSVNSLLENV